MSRVEGFMSRARVPCRGSRVEGNIFFSNFFFWGKVVIDAINVIKKNLKNKWRVNIRESSEYAQYSYYSQKYRWKVLTGQTRLISS